MTVADNPPPDGRITTERHGESDGVLDIGGIQEGNDRFRDRPLARHIPLIVRSNLLHRAVQVVAKTLYEVLSDFVL